MCLQFPQLNHARRDNDTPPGLELRKYLHCIFRTNGVRIKGIVNHIEFALFFKFQPMLHGFYVGSCHCHRLGSDIKNPGHANCQQHIQHVVGAQQLGLERFGCAVQVQLKPGALRTVGNIAGTDVASF